MNRMTREAFKSFACKINIGGYEYQCVPETGSDFVFLLLLNTQQENELLERYKSANLEVSCEVKKISKGYVRSITIFQNHGIRITKVNVIPI